MTIGFTNDGLVFLTDTSTSPNGQPAQITLTWEPRIAMQVADLIQRAAKQAQDAGRNAPRIILPIAEGVG